MLARVHKDLVALHTQRQEEEEEEGVCMAKAQRSPYIIFCTEKRPGIRISHPDASFGETGKIMGQMWADLDEQSREVSLGLSLFLSFSLSLFLSYF
jgi:hypothetical protein